MIDIKETTPIEEYNGLYFKRDDMFEVAGVKGGKARSAYQLIQQGLEKGYTEFVTAGSRMSPQCELVSYLCQSLGYKCHLFMPDGPRTSVIDNILKNDLSEIQFQFPRYNNVICARAKKYAEENNLCYIPFGMECKENVDITMHQVANIPEDCHQIVIPIGSGMSFISVMNGLEYYKRYDIKVMGIRVGKDPQKNISKYLNAPNINYEIVEYTDKYEKPADVTNLYGVELDPHYEAKCISMVKDCMLENPNFTNSKILLWVVGIRKN